MPRCPLLIAVVLLLTARLAAAGEVSITDKLHHLRVGPVPEWSDFSVHTDGPKLSLQFQGTANKSEWTLRLRQQDVKETWRVQLNNKEVGRLLQDENDHILFFSVPSGTLVRGENRLTIEQLGTTPDDIRVGEISLDARPRNMVISDATVSVSVQEIGSGGQAEAIPARITIVSQTGGLMTVGAASGKALAVRPGVIYSGNGHARFTLPAGEYAIYAGRGFEYGVSSVRISLRPGDTVEKTLSIRREVPTPGYVSCDTHTHTLTYSGHGDATVDERVLTIAGEGIELPIATDHNRQIDLRPVAVRHGVDRYFTPVIGNEVTTAVGHFNVFPVRPNARVPDFQMKNWKSLFGNITERTGAKIVILNHPRDLHTGFRPFGPEHHLAIAGENLDGWELRANAMEVINSGAQQSDMMQLYRDWFGLLNRGIILTPVGSSDSHDVSRYILGQGRTYIRSKDEQPGRIDLEEATENFRKGRVMVSLGLLAEITVNDQFGPGDLAPATGDVQVSVRVLGPGWTAADKVELYANGQKIREAAIADGKRVGIKWSGSWTLPRFSHDVHLVAIASGPSVTDLFWPIAKPYQPTSPIVKRRVVGSTGAVWIDADGDGHWTSPRAYAERLFQNAKSDLTDFVRSLEPFDAAVAIQAASLLRGRGLLDWNTTLREQARRAGPHVEQAFQAYAEAWRDCQVARSRSR